MKARQTLFNAKAELAMCRSCLCAQGLRGVDAGLIARSHRLCGEIGVGPSPVPIAPRGLGIESGVDAKVLADPIKQPPCDPQLVGHFQGPEGADLELPLTRHYLRIDAEDAKFSLKAGL